MRRAARDLARAARAAVEWWGGGLERAANGRRRLWAGRRSAAHQALAHCCPIESTPSHLAAPSSASGQQTGERGAAVVDLNGRQSRDGGPGSPGLEWAANRGGGSGGVERAANGPRRIRAGQMSAARQALAHCCPIKSSLSRLAALSGWNGQQTGDMGGAGAEDLNGQQLLGSRGGCVGWWGSGVESAESRRRRRFAGGCPPRGRRSHIAALSSPRRSAFAALSNLNGQQTGERGAAGAADSNRQQTRERNAGSRGLEWAATAGAGAATLEGQWTRTRGCQGERGGFSKMTGWAPP